GGTFKLSESGNDSASIAYGASAATVETAVDGISSVGADNSEVSGSGTIGDPYLIEFVGDLAQDDIDVMTVDVSSLTGGKSITVADPVGPVPGVNEIQRVSIDPAAIDGVVYLLLEGRPSSSIDYNASASAVDTALEAAQNIGSGNVDVQGAVGGPFLVEFIDDLKWQPLSLLQMDQDSLTIDPNQDPAIDVDETQQGTGPNHFNNPANWSLGHVLNSGERGVFASGSSGVLYGMRQRSAFTFDSEFNGEDTTETLIVDADFVDGQILRYRGTGLAPTYRIPDDETDYTLDDETDLYVLSFDPHSGRLSVALSDEANEPLTFTDGGDGEHYIELRCVLEIHSRYTGQIGLPQRDSAGFFQDHLPQYLAVGLTDQADNVVIGLGDGSGSGRIKIDSGLSRLRALVIDTGGEIEAGVPPVLFLTEAEDSEVTALSGQVGVAVHARESSTLARVEAYNGGSPMAKGYYITEGEIADFRRLMRAFRNGDLNRPAGSGSPRPDPGAPVVSVMLLEDLEPGSDALAVRLIPTTDAVQDVAITGYPDEEPGTFRLELNQPEGAGGPSIEFPEISAEATALEVVDAIRSVPALVQAIAEVHLGTRSEAKLMRFRFRFQPRPDKREWPLLEVAEQNLEGDGVGITIQRANMIDAGGEPFLVRSVIPTGEPTPLKIGAQCVAARFGWGLGVIAGECRQFNPAEPNPYDGAYDGDGAGNQNGLAPGFLIDVELGENSYGVDYYPEAGGRHLLTRRLTYQTPFGAGFPAKDDFERHDYALALFEAPPADPTRPGHAWRLAYRWPFSRFAGQPDGMSDQQWQQVQLDAMADLLLALAEGGVDVDFTDDFGNTDLQGFAIPPSDGWVLWYGPEFWLSPTAASYTPEPGEVSREAFEARALRCFTCAERRGMQCPAGDFVSLAKQREAACPVGRWNRRPSGGEVNLERLGIVAVHFNPAGFQRQVENFERFRASLGPLVSRLFVVELSFNGRFECAGTGPNDTRLEADPGQAAMWQKEALINTGIERLPAGVDVVAWIDADFLFLDPGWVADLFRTLDRFPTAQLCSWVHNLGPGGVIDSATSRPSLAAVRLGMRDVSRIAGPGGCWAARRDFLADARGLPDRHILGGGDRAWADGVFGISRSYYLDQLPEGLRRDQQKRIEWLSYLTRGEVGCLSGEAVHLFHGSRKNRQYRERTEILRRHNYDPLRHVTRNPAGFIEWTDAAPRRFRQE
ncbi:Uncharacterized protein SCF082_LOCUS12683, partial [Durusdinium trenchii]